jgi:hypothetical protein
VGCPSFAVKSHLPPAISAALFLSPPSPEFALRFWHSASSGDLHHTYLFIMASSSGQGIADDAALASFNAKRPVDLGRHPRDHSEIDRAYVWVSDFNSTPVQFDELPDHPSIKQRELMTTSHVELFRHLRFFEIDPPIDGSDDYSKMYVMWKVPSQGTNQNLACVRDLFKHLNLHKHWLNHIGSKGIKTPHPVYVEYFNGGPFGRFAYELTKGRLQFVKGLYVQMFGQL